MFLLAMSFALGICLGARHGTFMLFAGALAAGPAFALLGELAFGAPLAGAAFGVLGFQAGFAGGAAAAHVGLASR